MYSKMYTFSVYFKLFRNRVKFCDDAIGGRGYKKLSF